MVNEQYLEYYNQGEVLISMGKVDEAMEYYKKAEAVDPNHTELYISMGLILAHQDKLDEAEKIFKKALYVDKKCGEAYFNLGCLAGLQGDSNQAVTYIDMARTNGYESAQMYFTLGLMYEDKNEANMALRNYNKALSLEPVRPDINLQKINLLIREKRQEESVEAADFMIKNCPDYFEGYHLKCHALLDMKKYDLANEVLVQGLEMFPEEKGFRLDQARILVEQKKYDEAEKLLLEIEGDSAHWKKDVAMERIKIAGLQENMEKTTMLLEKAYAEFREDDGSVDEEICYLLLSVYMNAKRYDEVMKVSKELIKVSENETYLNIAMFYNAEALNKAGRTDEAKAAFEETIKRCRMTVLKNPAQLDAYMIRALSLNRIGDNDKALEMVDYILALSPESVEVHSAKAVILKDMGRMEEMQKEVEFVNSVGGAMSTVMAAL